MLVFSIDTKYGTRWADMLMAGEVTTRALRRALDFLPVLAMLGQPPRGRSMAIRRLRVTAVVGALVAACLAVLPSSAARADASPFYTGRQFLRMCAPPSTQATFPCGGYVMGAYDAALGGDASICLTRGARDSTLLAAVVQYLTDNPDQESGNAATLVVDAISAAYPC